MLLSGLLTFNWNRDGTEIQEEKWFTISMFRRTGAGKKKCVCCGYEGRLTKELCGSCADEEDGDL